MESVPIARMVCVACRDVGLGGLEMGSEAGNARMREGKRRWQESQRREHEGFATQDKRLPLPPRGGTSCQTNKIKTTTVSGACLRLSRREKSLLATLVAHFTRPSEPERSKRRNKCIMSHHNTSIGDCQNKGAGNHKFREMLGLASIR